MTTWTSIKDKLPEFKKKVLIVWIARSGDKCQNISTSTRFEIDDKWYFEGFSIGSDKITHWMPLPELPLEN